MKQEQFLTLATAEEAEEIFNHEIQPGPLGEEKILLQDSLGRILSRDITSQLNIPYFDRSNYDGFAVRAEDTFGAEEISPITLSVNSETLASGVIPSISLDTGTATPIATGGVLPRGANSVIMVEDTLPADSGVKILKPVVPGSGVSFAGSDMGAGEIVLRKTEVLSSREIGVLAATGEKEVHVWRKPKVGVISTGDEIIAPGEKMEVGKVYDSNGMFLIQALKELGCEPVYFGIIPDDSEKLEQTLREAIKLDFILLSGGTSKGAGDLNYQVVNKIGNPGILVHGVALKPGKPLCLASLEGTPTAILPGFPTSALFTFTKFIAPVLSKMAGHSTESNSSIEASIPMKINSQKGRTEFTMVNLVQGDEGFSAYSMGKGSGSITTFAKADGFIEIPRQTELIQAGSKFQVQILGESTRPADLMIIGSQCIGLDYLIGLLQQEGIYCKFIPVGSMGGVMAAKRGECDLAGSHLMNENGVYNKYLLTPDLQLIKGYKRRQGIVYRKDDVNFKSLQEDFDTSISNIINNENIRFINRNRGSGTRVLLDQLLKGKRPTGFFSESKSHNAVAATVAQKRADWGMAIQTVAKDLNLGFHPYQDEEYDFIIPKSRIEKPAMKRFQEILDMEETKKGLNQLDFKAVL